MTIRGSGRSCSCKGWGRDVLVWPWRQGGNRGWKVIWTNYLRLQFAWQSAVLNPQGYALLFAHHGLKSIPKISLYAVPFLPRQMILLGHQFKCFLYHTDLKVHNFSAQNFIKLPEWRTVVDALVIHQMGVSWFSAMGGCFLRTKLTCNTILMVRWFPWVTLSCTSKLPDAQNHSSTKITSVSYPGSPIHLTWIWLNMCGRSWRIKSRQDHIIQQIWTSFGEQQRRNGMP